MPDPKLIVLARELYCSGLNLQADLAMSSLSLAQMSVRGLQKDQGDRSRLEEVAASNVEKARGLLAEEPWENHWTHYSAAYWSACLRFNERVPELKEQGILAEPLREPCDYILKQTIQTLSIIKQERALEVY